MLFMGERRVREDRADLREDRKEQLAMDDGGVDSREYRARDYSQREYGKNIRVVGYGESRLWRNSSAMLIQGDDVQGMDLRG
jgi:hypothetical protein